MTEQKIELTDRELGLLSLPQRQPQPCFGHEYEEGGFFCERCKDKKECWVKTETGVIPTFIKPSESDYSVTEMQLRIIETFPNDCAHILSAIRSRPVQSEQSIRQKVLRELGKLILEKTGCDKQRPFDPDDDLIPSLGVDELGYIIEELQSGKNDEIKYLEGGK